MRIKELYPGFMQILVPVAKCLGVFPGHKNALTPFDFPTVVVSIYTCAGQPSTGHSQGVGEGEEDCELVIAGVD